LFFSLRPPLSSCPSSYLTLRRLHAFDRKVHFSNRDKEVQQLKHDLGAKIAKYFQAEHSNL
jgi:hypothetical protein